MKSAEDHPINSRIHLALRPKLMLGRNIREAPLRSKQSLRTRENKYPAHLAIATKDP